MGIKGKGVRSQWEGYRRTVGGIHAVVGVVWAVIEPRYNKPTPRCRWQQGKGKVKVLGYTQVATVQNAWQCKVGAGTNVVRSIPRKGVNANKGTSRPKLVQVSGGIKVNQACPGMEGRYTQNRM